MLYIMYAFRTVPGSYRYAVSAVIALVHDVLIVLGIFAVLGVGIQRAGQRDLHCWHTDRDRLFGE